MSRVRRHRPLPPLPYRARPPQVLLGVGAVLLVSAGAAVASAYGGAPARAAPVRARRRRGRVLPPRRPDAGCAAPRRCSRPAPPGLALAGRRLGGPELGGDARHRPPPRGRLPGAAPGRADDGDVAAGVLGWPPSSRSCAASTGSRTRCTPSSTSASPSSAWASPCSAGRSSAGVALRDDGAVVAGRRRRWLVERLGRRRRPAVALRGADGRRGLRACSLARLREPLDPLLGPPRLVPVMAGVVAGAAVTGAFSSLGPLAMTLTGYAGVLLANFAAAYLTGWRRGLFLPLALAAGIVMTALCVVQLVAPGSGGGSSPCSSCSPRSPRRWSPSAAPRTGRWRCRPRSAAWPGRCCWRCPTASSTPVSRRGAADGPLRRRDGGRRGAGRRGPAGDGRGPPRRLRAAAVLLLSPRGGGRRWRWSSPSRAPARWAGPGAPAAPRPGGPGRGLARRLAGRCGPAGGRRLGRRRVGRTSPPSSGTRCPRPPDC